MDTPHPISDATVEALKRLKPDFELCPVCRCCEMDTHWCNCPQCGGEGDFDGYDEDPMWYDPGDMVPCGYCNGRGGWSVHYCIGGCIDGKVHARTEWGFLEE